MKKAMYSVSLVLMVLLCVLNLAACKQAATDVWKDAIYTEDTELGEGATTLVVEVKAEDKMVTFTIHTDKDVVGDALLEHGLIAGDKDEYGLYVKTVNGILADYDVDRTYWGFYIDGEYAMTGVDATTITEGATYTLERTR
ncbi:MAG: DUF4430 domain-containing protein [Clostridia bacterium]|nr:DUF4430 domain-containing protein [Clostridia bacterium]